MTEIQLGAIAILSLGIFFRCTALGQKLYWYDEAFTSLRISGYSEAEVMQQAFHGQEITPQALQKYQHPNPQKGFWGTIRGLAQEEPQHPPLYYVLVRLWAQMVGSSAAAVRSLSVVFSLLVFPSLYWLCLELFSSPNVAWLAIALVAVSPLHVVFAQEARQYSLWTGLILAASATLLYAMRVDTPGSWTLYAVTLSLGLYTFLFSGLVAIGHGIYLIGVEHRWTPILGHYLTASIVGLMTFLPWIWAIATSHSSVQTTTAWANRPSSWKAIARVWALNLRRIFFDADFKLRSQFVYKASVFGVYAFVLLLEIGAVYWLWQSTSIQVWLFVLTLIGMTALAILLPDLILGGQRSTATRYAIPCYLGIQIAVAYCFVSQLEAYALGSWQQVLALVALGVAIALSILSCSIGAKTPIGWNKVVSYYNPPIANIINQSPRPLLIANTSMGVGEILSLSHLLDPNVTLQLTVDPDVPQIQAGFSDVFLMTYSQSLRSQLAAQQQAFVQPAYQERGKTWLWQLTSPNQPSGTFEK